MKTVVVKHSITAVRLVGDRMATGARCVFAITDGISVSGEVTVASITWSKSRAGPPKNNQEAKCQSCGGPLANLEGKFVLRYYFLRKTGRTRRRC